jgi:uncharacterized membrane protein YqaE (UPF0057 family)
VHRRCRLARLSRGRYNPHVAPAAGGIRNGHILRAILCIFLPPLAVLDKGCGSVLLVAVLTVCGWIPGIIGAMIICTRPPDR